MGQHVISCLSRVPKNTLVSLCISYVGELHKQSPNSAIVFALQVEIGSRLSNCPWISPWQKLLPCKRFSPGHLCSFEFTLLSDLEPTQISLARKLRTPLSNTCPYSDLSTRLDTIRDSTTSRVYSPQLAS